MEDLEKYSYSKLDTYMQCPFKYKLVYIDKKNIYTDSVATLIGTLVHATEENIAKLIQKNEPIDYIKLKNNFIIKIAEIEKKFYKDYWTPDKNGVLYKDKIYFYLDKGIYRLEKFMKEHPTYKIVGIEQEFLFDYETAKVKKCKFKGFIDRVFYDTATDKYIIQDIKTYAEPISDEKLTTPLQFVFYTLAADNLWGAKENQIICQYDLPFLDLTQDAGTKGYMTRGKAKLEKLFGSIDNKDFKPNPTPLCHWCIFCQTNPNQPEAAKHLCPYYSHWTRENKTFKTENEWQGMENHKLVLEHYLKSHNVSQIEGGELNGKSSSN